MSSSPSSSLDSASAPSSSSSVRREINWILAEGGVRYACVGVAKGRRGVDGPATGDAATSRRLGLDGVETAASAISTSSPSPSPSPSPSDEDEVVVVVVVDAEANCALLTGMTRIEEEAKDEEEARRGRFFDGVSRAKMPSSSSEADTISDCREEKATLRFIGLPFVREGVEFVAFA